MVEQTVKLSRNCSFLCQEGHKRGIAEGTDIKPDRSWRKEKNRGMGCSTEVVFIIYCIFLYLLSLFSTLDNYCKCLTPYLSFFLMLACNKIFWFNTSSAHIIQKFKGRQGIISHHPFVFLNVKLTVNDSQESLRPAAGQCCVMGNGGQQQKLPLEIFSLLTPGLLPHRIEVAWHLLHTDSGFIPLQKSNPAYLCAFLRQCM